MSRVDLTITRKEDQTLIVNRGFCRTSALEFFCWAAPDEHIQNFGYDLNDGLTLAPQNLSAFLERTRTVVDYFEGIPPERRPALFALYKEALYTTFIDDLKNAAHYLSLFAQDHHVALYTIEIL